MSSPPTSPWASIQDVTKQKEEGAGDQGIMFGYACRETEPLMPAPIYYAHRILHEMAKATAHRAHARARPRRQEPSDPVL